MSRNPGLLMPHTGQVTLECVGRTKGQTDEFRETIYVDLDRQTYCTSANAEVRLLKRLDESRITFRDFKDNVHPYGIDFAELDTGSMTYAARFALNARARIDRRTSATSTVVRGVPQEIAQRLSNARN